MTLPYSFNVQEMRYIDQSGTLTTAFTAADDATWDAATKLRIFDLDISGLQYQAEPDATIGTKDGHKPPKISTLRGGVAEQSISWSMYLEGGNGTITPPAVATLLGLAWGGIKSAAAVSDQVEAGTTSTNIVVAANPYVVGQGMLFGTLGDTKGGGKMGIVKTANAGDFDLLMALPGTPATSDYFYPGHTVYIDYSAETYQDFLIIGQNSGSSATDSPDQYNIIGCSLTAEIQGLNPGELPFVRFTARVGDWRPEPYANLASFTHTTAPEGADPASGRGTGAFTLGDYSATTRVTCDGGDLGLAVGQVVVPRRDPGNGINGIAGWKKMNGADGPVFTLTKYHGDYLGLVGDFTAQTRKQILIQAGYAAGSTVAIDIQKAYLDKDPSRAELETMTGLALTMHADVGYATDGSTADYILQDSAVRIHFPG